MTDHDDDGPRDENGDRLAVDVDRRAGGGTLADILAVAQTNAARLHESQLRLDAELAEHSAGCRADECARCGRVKCYRCGQVKQGLSPLCAACRDLERFERAKARVYASIPKRYRWATDGNLSALAARVKLPPGRISAALSWAAGLDVAPPGLVLSGDPGSGKTSLAVALFATWFAKHREEGVMFVTAIDLGLSRARHPLGHGDSPMVIAAMAAPLLILDDVGQEPPMHSDVIRQVLHKRHNDELPTWVTTGLGHGPLAQRYDGGLARRLYEGTKHVALGEP